MNKTIKNIGTGILVLGLMAGVLPVMAEENSTSTASTATSSIKVGKWATKGIKDIFKGDKKDAERVIKSKKDEERDQILKNSFLKIKNRFDAQIKNLESLAVRISNRIDKLSQQGKDVSEAKEKLNEAKIKIQEVKNAVSELKQNMETITISTELKKSFGEVKNKIVKEVAVKIKAAHKALVDTVVVLAKLSGSPAITMTATSTVATSTIETTATSTP